MTNFQQQQVKEPTAEESFDKLHEDIYTAVKKVMPNLSNDKIRESLTVAFQEEYTVFELINHLKCEDKCLQVINSKEPNIMLDNQNLYESKEITARDKEVIDNYKIRA